MYYDDNINLWKCARDPLTPCSTDVKNRSDLGSPRKTTEINPTVAYFSYFATTKIVVIHAR